MEKMTARPEELIEQAKKRRVGEINPAQLHNVPNQLRDVLFYITNAIERKSFEGEDLGKMTHSVAEAIATIDDILSIESRHNSLAESLEQSITSFRALSHCMGDDNEVKSRNIWWLLDKLHAQALDDIHSAMDRFIAIPNPYRHAQVTEEATQ